MPSFYDMAIDLLNEVKSVKDMNQKILILAQIKEIIIHRDPSIISDIISDVLDLMITDKSVPLKKNLIQLAGEALEKNITIVPNVVSLFNYICNDNFDPLLKEVAIQLSKLYSKILMFIVKMPPKTKAQISSGHIDPKIVWDELRSITKKIIETISSERSESLRMVSLRCVEDMILFGLPAPPLSSDPRVARQQALMKKESSSLNADEIPLRHPFISRDELEQESEDIFSQFLLWATRGGPQNFQFSPSLMSQLGQSISVVATSRPVKSSKSAAALSAMLPPKGTSCQLMTVFYRDNLSQKIQRLIRSSQFSTDTDGLMSKLKISLTNLTSLNIVNDDNINVTGVKRSINGEDENDSSDNLAEKDASALLRAKAIAAIDAAENDIKLKEAKLSEEGAIINNSTFGINSDNSLNKSSSGDNSIEQVVDTELSLELGEFPEISNNLSLATLSSNASTALVLNPITCDIYRDLATTTLQKMLESFSEIKIYGNKIKLSHIKISMRMVISLSLNELDTDSLGSKVFIISSLSTNSSKFNVGVPMDVDIPRPLWLALSFILTVYREEYNSALARLRDSKKGKHNKDHNVKSTLEDKVDMLLILMNELYTYITDESDEKNNMLYESSCLIIISRILQNLHLRSLAKNIIMGLPFIPLSSLSLLNLLTNTGSRAIASTKVINRKGKYDEIEKNRGTRTEARELLSNLIFSTNEYTAASSLNYLLWTTLSDDFETRDKSIKELIQKVIPHSDWSYQEISLFSVQVIISLLGIDEMKARLEERKLNKNINNIESNENKDVNNMSIIENEELNNEEVEEIVDKLTLEYSIDIYDEGVKFEGNFSIISPSLLANPSLVTSHVKKCLNLLLQMCVEYPELILLLMDLYGSSLSSSLLIEKQKQDDNNGIEIDNEIPLGKTSIVKEEEHIYNVICKVITDELAIIIPAVSSRHGTEEIFKIIVDSDPVALPLVEHILSLLHNNLHMPATSKLINMVAEFAKSKEPPETDIDIINIVKEEKDTMEVDEVVDNKSSICEVESSVESTLIIEKEIDLESVINNKNIKLFIPLIGGFTSQVIINLLPLIIQTLINEPNDKLKKTFTRIVQTRPPPLSKVALLTQLHRYFILFYYLFINFNIYIIYYFK
jgi:hypothetical protein